MNFWTIFVLLGALLPRAPFSYVVPVDVFLVVPQGETATTQDLERVNQSVSGAISFWSRAPNPVPLELRNSMIMTTTLNVYSTIGWGDPYIQDNTTAIFVILNRNSGKLLFGRVAGVAGLDAMYVVTGGQFEATVAHEIGHFVYGLPDLSPPFTRDIMSTPSWAYPDGVIGCQSLALLGTPCKDIYLPIIVR